MQKNSKVVQKLFDLCDYALKYCDKRINCTGCALEGVILRYDIEGHCPIYVITELRDAMIKEGADDGRYPT